MKITVETDSWAARYVAERIFTVEVPENATVADVINTIGLPADEAGIAVIHGEVVTKEHCLSQGDNIKIHPVIIGG